MDTTDTTGGVSPILLTPLSPTTEPEKFYTLCPPPAATSGVTEKDLGSLRRIPGKIPWQVYTIAFVVMCERFAFYGVRIVCKDANSSPETSRFNSTTSH